MIKSLVVASLLTFSVGSALAETPTTTTMEKAKPHKKMKKKSAEKKAPAKSETKSETKPAKPAAKTKP